MTSEVCRFSVTVCQLVLFSHLWHPQHNFKGYGNKAVNTPLATVKGETEASVGARVRTARLSDEFLSLDNLLLIRILFLIQIRIVRRGLLSVQTHLALRDIPN